MEFDPKCNGSRWVAYFDLLGMSDLIKSKGYIKVFNTYDQAIRQLDQRTTNHPQVQHAWFSDTFLVVATDDSGPSFAQVEQVARWFVYFMLEARIPLRGAIACGYMYADFSSRIFFGESLVEAYSYGEAQDWVGLVLCPSTMSAMKRLNVPAAERPHYALWTPKWSKKAPDGAPNELAACLLGSWISLNGCNPSRAKLQEMASTCEQDNIRAKYERAIKFIDDNLRQVVDDHQAGRVGGN